MLLPAFSPTNGAAEDEPRELLPLHYANRGLRNAWRDPEEQDGPRHFATAAVWVGSLSVVASVLCVLVVVAFAAKMDLYGGLALLYLAALAHWVGGGIGSLLALIGCFKERDSRVRPLGALLLNVMVAATPSLLIQFISLAHR